MLRGQCDTIAAFTFHICLAIQVPNDKELCQGYVAARQLVPNESLRSTDTMIWYYTGPPPIRHYYLINLHDSRHLSKPSHLTIARKALPACPLRPCPWRKAGQIEIAIILHADSIAQVDRPKLHTRSTCNVPERLEGRQVYVTIVSQTKERRSDTHYCWNQGLGRQWLHLLHRHRL